MTKLEDTIFICAPSFRSRAYAQAMLQAGIFPTCVIYLPGEEPSWNGSKSYFLKLDKEKPEFIFKPDEHARYTFDASNIPVIISPVKDVNSPQFVSFLKKFTNPVALYSGFPGIILGKDLLKSGKQFLHIHGGYAPRYRGSTAFYYSLLEQDSLGATAFWMEEKIDTGAIIGRKLYTAIDRINIDNILDPCVRADLLQDILIYRSKESDYPVSFYDNKNPFTYHVIHPVLKHIVLRRYNILD